MAQGNSGLLALLRLGRRKGKSGWTPAPYRDAESLSSRSDSFVKPNGRPSSPVIVEEPEGRALLSPNGDARPLPKSTKKSLGPPPPKPGTQYVNAREEDQMEITGFYPCMLQTFLTWCAIFCTVGLLRLVFHWRPEWMLRCTHVACSLHKATKILLLDQYKQLFVEDVKKMYPDKVMQNGTSTTVPVIPSDTKSPVTINGHTKLESPANLLRPGPQGEFLPTSCLIYFENKKIRYLWDSEIQEFRKVRGLDRNVPISYFHLQKGLSSQDQAQRLILYGKNAINVNVQSIFQILFQEVLEPFYVFQVFSVLIWYLDDYVYYASCIIVMSAMSLAASVYQIRKNQVALRDTVHAIDVVKVCRGKNEYEDIPSDQVVPGDVLVIPRYGCVMQCDAVLVNGNCIVNESMLTGESVPVTKTPVSLGSGSKPFHPKEDAKHVLFCGTKVIQTRYYDNENVKAVVIRTGFLTAKGELVRSIMFPKPVDFQFNRHIHKFILCLASLALVGFIFTVVYMVKEGISFGNIMLRALDLITITIPPALPAAMTIGIVFAQNRLKRVKIYCISPRSINISGCINCVCFDKTGTLTEDGLDLWGVVPVQDKRFQLPNHQPGQLQANPLLVGMATCHSLTIIDQQLTGDPLDLKMFEATKWQLEEPEIDDTAKYDIITPTIVRPNLAGQGKGLTDSMETLPYEVGIVRQFPFSSSLQRMSVITRTLGAEHFEVYCKGAPETIASLCDPDTVPEDFSNVLMSYTQQGFRVLALGFRPLPRLSYTKAQRIPREDLESQLNFLGLLVMENRLKEETAPVLDILRLAGIRTVMITGDNMLTALSVARDCHMIENHHQVVVLSASQDLSTEVPQLIWHFSDMAKSDVLSGHALTSKDAVSVIMEKPDKVHVALSGKTFAVLKDHYPELLKKVAVSGTVFARMAPEQKQQLVQLLQEIGYYVAMCGDGANDCGALKAAHAGISLSETEASVASPFTSKTPNISCVPALIQEGRTALVTSFGVLKYMACYSLAQFISVIILYSRHTNLTDLQFLYVDLFLITLFVALFGRTGAFQTLAKRPPPSSLISLAPLSSLFSQVVLILSTQLAGIGLLWQQSWYKPKLQKMDPHNLKCHDNYAIFSVSVFQYIVLAVVTSKGAPYRKSITTNTLFLASLLIMTAFTLYLVIHPDPWLADQFEFELTDVTIIFRVALVGIAVAYFALSLLVENFLIDYLLYTKCQSCQRSPSEYQLLEQQTCGAPTWLPSNLSALCPSPVDSSSIGGDTFTHSETASTILHALDAEARHASPVSPNPSQLSCFSAFNIPSKPTSEQDSQVKVELPCLEILKGTSEEKTIHQPIPKDDPAFTRL